MNQFNEEPFVLTNKAWFDGYAGEKVVVVEDLDKYTAHEVAHSIKLWADRYPTQVECKGGKIWLQHQVLIVTSNLTIDEAFGPDQ